MRAFERRVTTVEAVTPEIRPRVQTGLKFPSLYLLPTSNTDIVLAVPYLSIYNIFVCTCILYQCLTQ